MLCDAMRAVNGGGGRMKCRGWWHCLLVNVRQTYMRAHCLYFVMDGFWDYLKTVLKVYVEDWRTELDGGLVAVCYPIYLIGIFPVSGLTAARDFPKVNNQTRRFMLSFPRGS